MIRLNKDSIKDKSSWLESGIALPEYNFAQLVERTKEEPVWVHFGAGNIFRGYIAMLVQELISKGKLDKGIIAVETYDYEIIERIYKPYDNLGLQVKMKADGTIDNKVIASITEGIAGDSSNNASWDRLKTIFRASSLQICSFTITEKGYGLTNLNGEFSGIVKDDIENGTGKPNNVMAKLVALLYERFNNGQSPIALLSTDNFSHNGDKLKASVLTMAEEWYKKGHITKSFLDYLKDSKKVSFPWSMIDKITPRPSSSVQKKLEGIGFGSTEIIQTEKHTYIAPFVNTEPAQYLVIEDDFTNGRPKLEEAGVYFANKETVDKVERMKVCTCLNPLHTAMAIFGCLLGFDSISGEMEDKDIKNLIEKIGYKEGMPVVTDPGILNPMKFIKEVIEERLPNPYIPDTPQRIATDTSQKLAIRFGETIKLYASKDNLDINSLVYIPMAIAGWCRYLMAINDNGEKMELSPDPLLNNLKPFISKIEFGNPSSVRDNLKPILSNKTIFGMDLYEVGLGEKIEDYFTEMIESKGAVRKILQKY